MEIKQDFYPTIFQYSNIPGRLSRVLATSYYFLIKKSTDNIPRGIEKNCQCFNFFVLLVLRGQNMWLDKLFIVVVPAQHLHSRSMTASQNQNCTSMGWRNPRPKSLVASHYHQQMDCPWEQNSYPISSGLGFDSGLKNNNIIKVEQN